MKQYMTMTMMAMVTMGFERMLHLFEFVGNYVLRQDKFTCRRRIDFVFVDSVSNSYFVNQLLNWLALLDWLELWASRNLAD